MRRLMLCAAMAAAASVLLGCDGKQPAAAAGGGFKGVDITGAEYARELSLPDASGQPRALADFKGKVVVVFFGYTQCPDVCPTTLAELAEVRKQLGADGAKVQSIFVSVDPARDTAELLKAYVNNFGEDNIALRGTPEQTAAMAKEFKVFYAKVPGKTETSYTVDHTAASFLYDPQGRVRVYSRYGSGTEALAHDIKRLLSGA
ncbi:MAG: SCO family protein [Ideonella sp.]|nr:SCO family protein [Ideonella sp.]